jgi:hypothetical protein
MNREAEKIKIGRDKIEERITGRRIEIEIIGAQ